MSDPAICPDNSRTTTYDAIKLFKRRWYLLLLFCVYSASNSYQWIEYSVIAQTFTQFYGVHVRSIDWLSMVYMAVYIPLIIPASALTNRFGLRFSAVFGALLNALGAIIKCASINPSLFWVTAFGQTICAIAQLFILNLPSKIAATWFGLHEVSTACSLCVFGNQVYTF